MTILSGAKREEALASLNGWAIDPSGTAMKRCFVFADFAAAFAFMTRVALAAERCDHHPEWRNAWNRVEISLTTHDAGGLTEQDMDLARQIDRIAGECPN